MSNRLFQGIVHQMRDSIDRVIGVVDNSAVTISCSDLTRMGEVNEYLVIDLNENSDIFVRDGYTYKPFGTGTKPDYAVFVEGTDEIAAKYCNILAVSFASIKQYYDEKSDRNNFINFIFNINETDIILVKEIKNGIGTEDIEKLARSIVDTLSGEFYTKSVVGIGTIVTGIKDLSKSFKEAQVALEVGKVFDDEK